LVIVLLFLLAITGLTVWAARQSMLGEGMSRNMVDVEVARQAAESALRDAERDLRNAKTGITLSNASCNRGGPIIPANFDANCAKGLCYRSDAEYEAAQWITSANNPAQLSPDPWWPDSKGGQWGEAYPEGDSSASKPKRIPVGGGASCSFSGGVPLGVYTGAPSIRGVSIQPQYIIEYFKRSVPGRQEMAVYRITARGFGYARRTQVVLQTTFLPE
jgi:type IV pilus assembly protein PilX